jgi:flagellar biogenesis protein FliO
MTPLRQVFHTAMVVAALSMASHVSAEPLAPIGPPTAPTATPVPPPVSLPVATPPKVAAPASTPNWLASRPAPKTPVASRAAMPSLGRLLGLLLVVGSLGGAALYLKRRGAPNRRRPAAPKRLSVLSSTRIGPKAHAVVIAVAGRQMLLGVTDSSVKRLAFIDELVEDEEEARELPRRASPQAAARSAALAVRAAAPEPTQGRSFGELLKTTFKKREPLRGEDAASILAAETQDVVGGKPVATSVRMLDVEGQAQGLIRRLSGPRA